MSYTNSWVASTIDKLALNRQVQLVQEPERSHVLSCLKERFLTPHSAFFWWEHLRPPDQSWQTTDGYLHLPELASDPDQDCWLIAGLTDSDNEMVVAACTPKQATAILGECPGFEYALVDQELKWLVIENHHDFLLAAGDACERLPLLRRSHETP